MLGHVVVKSWSVLINLTGQQHQLHLENPDVFKPAYQLIWLVLAYFDHYHLASPCFTRSLEPISMCMTKTHTTKQECGTHFTTMSFSHPKHNQLTLAMSGQPKVGCEWPCL